MRLTARRSGFVYHVACAGAGRPLLLLHGFSGDCATWSGLRTRLERRFRLIAPDILGHGQSESPADSDWYRMGAVSADIRDLLGQLAVDQAHLLGYSMGGRLALFLALRYPRRFLSLTLEGASPGLHDERERARRRQRDDELADAIETRGLSWFVDYWEGLPLWRSQASMPADARARQRRQRLGNDALGLANSLRGMGTGAQPSLWRDLGELRIPTHLIVGERDSKFRRVNEEMARRVPGARLTVIPGAGHNTHLEAPALFCQAVLSNL